MNVLQLVSLMVLVAAALSQKQSSCKSFTYKECNNLGFKKAALPNPYNPKVNKPGIVVTKLKKFAKVAKSGCHPKAQEYICELLAAPCDEDKRGCKKECIAVKKACQKETKDAKLSIVCTNFRDCEGGNKPSKVKPLPTKSAASKPSATKPATSKPSATKPTTAKSSAMKPTTAKPGMKGNTKGKMTDRVRQVVAKTTPKMTTDSGGVCWRASSLLQLVPVSLALLVLN